jgi:hypothetical protein
LRYWTTPDPVIWSFVSLMAWSGIILALRRKRLDAFPYLIVLLMFPLVYCVTHTFPTYRHPTEPVMLLLAAYAVVSTLGWLTKTRKALTHQIVDR